MSPDRLAGAAPIGSVRLRFENDVVAARQRTRQIAAHLGFDPVEQTRLATAVSEIARNAFRYAGGGLAEFFIEGRSAPQVFAVRISDQGPGIRNLAEILAGHYRSTTGMGLGITGARRLMDRFEIQSEPGLGTRVCLRRLLPTRTAVVDAARLGEIANAIDGQAPQTAFEEVQRQNQELLRALDELQRRQDELAQLNRELEDTNRGVVALYAELDEKADHLRRADELKSRFLSNMTHEFRTPLNAILALSRLLLDRTDGELTPEQDQQVRFVLRAGEGLSELVNDLLDLAKVEAGKTVVRPVEFEVRDLFGALRGMLRPLLLNDAVTLSFEHDEELPPLHTDEGKVSQILRNFVSNALKFTERGEIVVSARMSDDRESMEFSVRDTGIGIAPEDQERIFQEFTQVEHSLQRRVRGTGLGLPLSRRLAELLGGSLSLTSTAGAGSTFRATIPIQFSPLVASSADTVWRPDPNRLSVLVIEDAPESFLTYQKYLRGTSFEAVPARTLREARLAMERFRPGAIILDVLLKGEDTWSFLGRLKDTPATAEIPVLVVSTVDDPEKALSLGADDVMKKPVDRQSLLVRLAALTGRRMAKILIIDDDEVSRYLLRGTLAGSPHMVLEASSGHEGLQRAREERPDLIFLDLVLPDLSGFETLERLKIDIATRHIPVAVHTSKVLDEAERLAITREGASIIPKATASREEGRAMVREVLARSGLAPGNM